LQEDDMLSRIAKAALALATAITLLGAAGCSQTQQYMATGGALGAGGGALVAAATGGSALGGAVVGGAVGTGAGYIMSR
jgi:hypothetical protein